MPRRHDPDVAEVQAVEDILRALVDGGWEDSQPVAVSATQAVSSDPVQTFASAPASIPLPALANDDGASDYDPDDPDTPTPPAQILADIGLLSELAVGRKDAAAVARQAGMSLDALQSQVAVTLAEVPPEDIARVVGLQAAQQQLKSGAIYGAVLATLADDLIHGRMNTANKLEMAKLLARVGRVEPREDKSVNVGSGFTLNINLGEHTPPVVIEAVPAPETVESAG